jgi:hypothetical protein
MNNITNAYILEKMMYGLYNTAGRRTTYSFAIAIMDTITRTLEQRYDFLKYLLFKTQRLIQILILKILLRLVKLLRQLLR